MRTSTIALILMLCGHTSAALADLPLTVEDLVTDKGKLKLELGFSYANAEQTGVSTGEPIAVQTGVTSFVLLPSTIGERNSNRDTLVGTVGVRYGFSGKTEVLLRTSYLHVSERVNDTNGPSKNHQNRFADTWLGVNHQFREEDDHPALLGFAEVALSEHLTGVSKSLKSAMIGFTSYKAIDPIVFSLTGAYRFSRSYSHEGYTHKSGNLLMFSPSIGFAVNDRVTLTTGLQWTRLSASRLNGTSRGINRTASDLQLGVGYGFARGNTLNTTFRANASGNRGAELRVSWLYTF